MNMKMSYGEWTDDTGSAIDVSAVKDLQLKNPWLPQEFNPNITGK